MPELPLCKVQWPGMDTYFEAVMTIGQGTEPGKCLIVCPAQNHPIQAFGELSWTAGNTAVRFPACRVDKIEMTRDPKRGALWQITILDRRWRWGEFGHVEGWYNIRLGNLSIWKGPPTEVPPSSAGGQSTTEYNNSSERTPTELAEICLKAMNEEHYDVSALPTDTLRPETFWDPPVPPAHALEAIVEMTACRVVPHFRDGVFDAVRIVRMGEGADLPTTNLEFNEGFDTAELPDRVGIYLAPTLVDVQLPLIPVISTDLFSMVEVERDLLFGEDAKRLSAFVTWPKIDQSALPVYDPEAPPQPWELWRELPQLLRERMQMQIGSWWWYPIPVNMPQAMQPDLITNQAMWTKQMQEKLKNEALLCYQVRLPFTVPDWGEITSHDQYVLELQRATHHEDVRTGMISRDPAYVYGSWCMLDGWFTWTNSEALFDQLFEPVSPDKPLIYQGGFQIDPENKLVRFSQHMYRFTNEPHEYKEYESNIFDDGAKSWSPTPTAKGHYFEPAFLVLRTSIRLLSKNRNQLRYAKAVGITPYGAKIDKEGLPPEGKEPLTEWFTRDDMGLRGKVHYTPSFVGNGEPWLEPTETEWINKQECEDNANYYLGHFMQKYQTKVPQRARYPGLNPIQLDGAIEQVTYYSSKDDGSFTVACRNSEWAFGALLPYAQRRQLKELWSYRRAKEETDKTKINEMKRWVFVPSSTGGQYGLVPPGG